jgi:sucrose-6-phosphate hydrolase SacC (GH32 family)
MTTSVSGRAASRPVIHVSPRSGWLNDPNGLCFHRGVWHAFYQHDPDTDVHGTMHWGHATSDDLVHWVDRPIALVPDRLGTIFSGSVVVDDDDTAGFGAGAMVAVFTHHHNDVERQSLAYSRDDGLTWQPFADNPVLESDERDFRDPKVFRDLREGRAAWIMALAVGHRIEFYRSADLRRWELTGSYATELPGTGLWECPDLIRFDGGDGPPGWLLVFSVVGIGPEGHGGTLGVRGEFDGLTFRPHGRPALLDHGPDFYAAQSFWGAPGDGAVVMAWMSSWLYSRTHPSAGRRGVLSLPRRVRTDGGPDGSAIISRPSVDLASLGVRLDGRRWSSEPARAVHVRARNDVEVVVHAPHGDVATIRIEDGAVSLRRHEPVVDGYAQTYSVSPGRSGPHEIVIDQGTLEVFAGDGAATLSALFFAGEHWALDVDGDAVLTLI